MLFPVTVHCDAPKLNKNNEKNAVRIFSVIQNVSAVEEFSFCFSKHMIMSEWCMCVYEYDRDRERANTNQILVHNYLR